MEITCSRCHQPVDADSCYCPSCGLPQLVYSNDANAGPAQPEKWTEAVTDASLVEWKPALQVSMMLAVPAGLLSSGMSRAGLLGLIWMVGAAAWAVTIYVRRRRSPWITIGAGARIGLVTGLMSAALAFGFTGLALFVKRYVLHQGAGIDSEWGMLVEAVVRTIQTTMAQMGVPDQGQYLAQKNLMLSPEGHAAYEAVNAASNEFFLVLFAAAGGAMGARFLTWSKRTQG